MKNNFAIFRNFLVVFFVISSVLSKDKIDPKAKKGELCMERFVNAFNKFIVKNHMSMTGLNAELHIQRHFMIMEEQKNKKVKSSECAKQSNYKGDLTYPGSKYSDECKRMLVPIYKAYIKSKGQLNGDPGKIAKNLKGAKDIFVEYTKTCTYGGHLKEGHKTIIW